MAEWMVTQLKEWRGVSKKLGQEWLKKGQVLPLLDGLDELKSERQERCVQAINQFVQDSRLQHLVVCSRREEYERCPTKLELQGAVCLLPLTEEQIGEYLRRTSCMDFWPHLQQDSNLLELAKTPLFLNVIALAYSEIALEEWQKLESSAARQQYLFDAYIERMLKRDPISKRWYRRGQEPSAEQTKHWLRFLAKQLKAEGRTEFLIEKMQPTWLKNHRQRRIYGLIFGLIFGLSFGLIHGLKVDIRSRTQPNQGIWQSAKNTLAIVLITLPGWAFSWYGQSLVVTKAIALGLGTALGVGFILSGVACIQHFSLRLILWLNDSIPWNYARFLNCATERLLLQRVGGGYRFMHDLLREHFATQV